LVEHIKYSKVVKLSDIDEREIQRESDGKERFFIEYRYNFIGFYTNKERIDRSNMLRKIKY
jgi:spermidine/putrescine-binding protein